MAIVLNKATIKTDDTIYHTLIEGRAILTEIPWQANNTLRILVVYAPNNSRDNKSFWEELTEIFERNPNLNPDVILGDLNIVEDGLDRAPGHLDEGGAVEALRALKNQVCVADGWRRTNPNRRGFTYIHKANGSQSRIDRIYVAEEMLHECTEWKIETTSILTDHQMISARISTATTPLIGRGRWAIPLYVLEDEQTWKEICKLAKRTEDEIEAIKYRRTANVNPQTIYKKFKENVRETCRVRARKIVPAARDKIRKLYERLEWVNNCPLHITPDDIALEVIRINEDITALERHLFETNRNTSAVKNRLEGETISRYWTKLNKERKPRDTIHRLKNPLNETDDYETNSTRMAEIARDYHEKLQNIDRNTTEETNPQEMNKVLDHIPRRLTVKQRSDLAKRVKRDDISEALANSANGKAAGMDGIPTELWKKLNDEYDPETDEASNTICDIIEVLMRVYNDIETHGVQPGSGFNDGWMCPIYKKGDKENIANYRPITVLNTDYKIFTKVLSERLANVAPDLIHNNQVGFVKGRSIFDQVKLAKLMIDYGEIKEVSGAIVALDQEKAYDKIMHAYLWKVLERFGLPNHFIRTVKTLYENAATVVIINGVISTPFLVIRGVRQGDPLSCLLFDLSIEPMAEMIRRSSIRGIEVPGTNKNIKCKLFADDTVVYLSHHDSFLQLHDECLTPWCKAAGAKFNIPKTLVIPIGPKNYRVKMIETRKLNENGPSIPDHICIVGEEQPVRILGGWVGNEISQVTPWAPVIERISANLKRWEAGHPTIEGRRLIVQMVVAGMTQYLTKVQGMPGSTERTLTDIIRKFTWNGEGRPAVSLDYLSCNTKDGGKKVLDINARNEAIHITWLQTYLNMEDNRPTWAFVADEILAADIPKDQKIADTRQARVNQFLQTWHSRMTAPKRTEDPDQPPKKPIPEDLRDMLQVAKKYNVKLEAILPSKEVQTRMPVLHHVQIRKPVNYTSVTAKCLQDKHHIMTISDLLLITENLPRNHVERRDCKCPRCKELREKTQSTCKRPNKCIAKAREILKSLNPKWDPTKNPKADFFTRPEPKETGHTTNPETEEEEIVFNPFTVQEKLTDCIRIFTEPEGDQPDIVTRAEPSGVTHPPDTEVYTDGSCIRNGQESARAGSGIWYGLNDARNTSIRITGPEQSNQMGELIAILHVIKTHPPDAALTIKSDSKYAIEGLTKHLESWENTGWTGVRHAEVFKCITAWMRHRSNVTKFIWVKGHSGIDGNEEADKLARKGAEDEPPSERLDLTYPPNKIPTGAKLAALTQADLYHRIKKQKKVKSRERTRINVERMQACIEDHFQLKPSPKAIWMSIRSRDISRNIRDYLWKTMHSAYKVGKFWDNIPGHEQWSLCPVCETEESMEHILLECDAPGRTQIWKLANKLWTMRSNQPLPSSYGSILGCGIAAYTKKGKPDTGLNRLFKIIMSESAHLIWKLRCERRFAKGDDPQKHHPEREIHNRWVHTMNSRLTIDSLSTNVKKFREKATKAKLVLQTWEGCLQSNEELPRNWCGKKGVLVGIAPVRRERRR